MSGFRFTPSESLHSRQSVTTFYATSSFNKPQSHAVTMHVAKSDDESRFEYKKSVTSL